MVSAPLHAQKPDADSKARLRLWIRLLRASRLIESTARERLKSQFNATLPRFDVMAALYRRPDSGATVSQRRQYRASACRLGPVPSGCS